MSLESERGKEFRISIVDPEQIEALFSLARSLPRKRATLTLYRSQGEKTHTEIKAILPETYIRPHKHINPHQTETFVPLRGIAELVTFSDEGEILQKVLVGREMVAVAEVEANTWYTLVARTPFAAFEVKVHPAGDDKGKGEVFAPWAPEEGTKEADIYFENFRQKLGLSGAS